MGKTRAARKMAKDAPKLKMGMGRLVATVLSLLRPRDRLKVALLLFLMLVNGLVVTSAAAALVPFLMVATDPSKIETNAYLAWGYETFGFSEPTHYLIALGLLVFGLMVAGTVVGVLKTWISTRFSSMHQYRLSRELMRHYLSRHYEFFLTRNSADLSKTVLDETRQVVSGFLNPLLNLISSVILSVMLVSLLLAASPVVALVLVGILGTLYGTIFLMSRKWLGRIGEDRVLANKQRFLAAQEAFGAVKDIKLLGREDIYLSRYRDAAHRYAWHNANASLLSSLPSSIIETVLTGTLLVIALVLLTADGGRGFAEAVPLIGLYLVAGRKLVPAFQGFFSKVTTIRFHAAALENFLADMPEGIAHVGPRIRRRAEPLVPQRSVSLERVVYRYPEGDGPALDGLTLRIGAGEVVGIAGASGAGKSTLVDILLGMLTPQTGSLQIDGDDLPQDKLESWQAALGYVPQHIFLADDTVAHNIALGERDEAIDPQRLERVARMACIHDFIVSELPRGYETTLGERGIRLSGGQRQRIGIARALYRDPGVLLLDEATSALDNQTERAVMEAIHGLHESKTVIVVAHRLTTLEPCDRIVVLDRGRVVDQGTYAELMGRDGLFRAMAIAGQEGDGGRKRRTGTGDGSARLIEGEAASPRQVAGGLDV
jgi:ATP-binding cassette, subfamily B, bacterial PglK